MSDHNEAMRLTEDCKHGWLENVDPDKCSLDDLLALIRKQAERIAELEARVHTCGPTCSKAGCINRRLTAERDTLRAEVDQMTQAIAAFCEGNSWAVDAWKNRPDIKPLFDIDTARKATQ